MSKAKVKCRPGGSLAGGMGEINYARSASESIGVFGIIRAIWFLNFIGPQKEGDMLNTR